MFSRCPERIVFHQHLYSMFQIESMCTTPTFALILKTINSSCAWARRPCVWRRVKEYHCKPRWYHGFLGGTLMNGHVSGDGTRCRDEMRKRAPWKHQRRQPVAFELMQPGRVCPVHGASEYQSPPKRQCNLPEDARSIGTYLTIAPNASGNHAKEHCARSNSGTRRCSSARCRARRGASRTRHHGGLEYAVIALLW